jgi:Mlc titration factor MtfA (ptsG expression regulator)
MLENNFKAILQHKRKQLNEDLIYTDSRDMRIGLQAQIELLDKFTAPLFAEMQYNLVYHEETISKLEKGDSNGN